MISMPIDNYVSHSVIRDLKSARSLIPPKSSVRLYRIPVEEFEKGVDAVVGKCFLPFRPTLLGLPVDMGTKGVPELVIVHDDDTNAAQTPIREEEV